MSRNFKIVFNENDEAKDEKSSQANTSSREKGHLKVVTPKDVRAARKKEDSWSSFDMEFEEKSKQVNLKTPSKEEMSAPNQTFVKIIENEGQVTNIDPKDLKEIIKTNKGIKQVVVEKIGVQEASRISLKYAKESSVKSLKASDRPKLGIDKPALDIREFEKELNGEFLGIFINGPTFDNKNTVLVIDQDQDQVQNQDQAQDKKTKESLQVTPYKAFSSEDEDASLKDVSYTKHTLNRKSKNHNGHYYRAKNHVELFKVGNSYLDDFHKGLKSFAFSSFGLDEDREKSVFGVAAFFNYHAHEKLCIVGEKTDKAFYFNFVKNYKRKKIKLDDNVTLDYYESKGFDFVDFADFRSLEKRLRNTDFEDVLDLFIDQYDIILWDMPEISILDHNKEIYFPVIRTLDNVTFVASSGASKIKELDELKNYYKRYQVDLKGILFRTEKNTKKKEGK